jgi:hypothetical protein
MTVRMQSEISLAFAYLFLVVDYLAVLIFVCPIAVTDNKGTCLCRNFHNSVLMFVLHAAVVRSSDLL